MSIAEHLTLLMTLPEQEREEISRALWQSLDHDDAKIEIADYEKYLLLKRDDEFRIGKQTEDTWDNAKARLIEKIRGL